MKRFLIFIFIFVILLSFVSCSSNEENSTIKIGVIDSCITDETVAKFDIKNINNIIGVEARNNITHGSMMLEIISQNVSNYELYYCSVLEQDCTGRIEDVIKAINWCVENDVDIISMSFATIQDNLELRKAINIAISNDIVIVAACINGSENVCYPAMYEGVISVSEGVNTNATITIENRIFKINIDGHEFEKAGTSVLTAYVCGKISSEMSKGKKMDEIMQSPNFD